MEDNKEWQYYVKEGYHMEWNNLAPPSSRSCHAIQNWWGLIVRAQPTYPQAQPINNDGYVKYINVPNKRQAVAFHFTLSSQLNFRSHSFYVRASSNVLSSLVGRKQYTKHARI